MEPQIITRTPYPGFDPAESAPPPATLRPLPYKRAALLVFVPVAATAIMLLIEQKVSAPVLLVGLVAMFATFGGAMLAGVNGLRVLARTREMTAQEIAFGLGVSIATGAAGMFAAMTAAAMTMSAGRGRQLRVRGKPQYAPLDPKTAWIDTREVAQDHDVELSDVAEAWRTNGLTEHASVAAFAELSLDLMSLGAPPALIAAAHEDALDEMRHTTLCFELARSLDGRVLGPRDFASAVRLRPRVGPRSMRLAKLAVTSLFDGALYEGLSARVVASLAKTDVDARVRPVLEAIAKDEARHAAHGMDVVRWCLAEGGAPVREAVLVALDAAKQQAPHGLGGPLLADGRFERYGLPGREREIGQWGVVLARVERTLATEAVVIH